ncbi:hypothetical protein KEJ21_01405 [Candidatus Bathyarchaeota archaeon]|nr:hypothetical protein [Candidatus Bathyarchaeota archaeon]MBS7630726.1 hypothetical protein [Candidatus Bathyarchaeota archaeon]
MQTHPAEDFKEELLKIQDEQIKDSKDLERKDYTAFQKLLLRVFGRIHVGREKKTGWDSPLPLYAFRCSKHGIQTAYPSGWSKTLLCPECVSEVSAEMKHKIKT